MYNIQNALHQPVLSLTFKSGVLLVIGLYLIFLLIILKQIRSMNTIITQPDLFPIIQLANFILIAFTIFIFLLGVVIL